MPGKYAYGLSKYQARTLKRALQQAGLGAVPDDLENLDRDRHSTPLKGWRHWHLVRHKGEIKLSSVVKNHVYEGPVAVTDPPTESGHGFYSMKKGKDFYWMPGPLRTVYGCMDLFGEVLECEHGFRSEKIRISKLYVRPGGWVAPKEIGGVVPSAEEVFTSSAPPPWPWPYEEIVEALSERYRCEVEYQPRPNGPQVLRSGENKFHNRLLHSGPKVFVHEPTFQEILEYGGHPWISANPYASTKSSLQKEMSSLRETLKEWRRFLKKRQFASQYQSTVTQYQRALKYGTSSPGQSLRPGQMLTGGQSRGKSLVDSLVGTLLP